jgi:hypothetical protein
LFTYLEFYVIHPLLFYVELYVNSNLKMRGFLHPSPLLATTIITILAVGGRNEQTAAELFAFEKTHLNENFLVLESPDYAPRSSDCKSFPGDASWPSDEDWSSLNDTMNGSLLKPSPISSVCYNNTVYNNFSASLCDTVSGNWLANTER